MLSTSGIDRLTWNLYESTQGFLPELLVAAGLVAVLLMRLMRPMATRTAAVVAAAALACVAAGGVLFGLWLTSAQGPALYDYGWLAFGGVGLLLLFVLIGSAQSVHHMGVVALMVLLVALVIAGFQWAGGIDPRVVGRPF